MASTEISHADGLELLEKILKQLTLIATQMERESKQADKLMTTDETAAYLGVKADTMAIWRHRGTGPRYHKVGSTVRYRLSELEMFLKEREVSR